MEEKIKYINQSVAESLQFAEAKNAALITFNGAALYVLIEGQAYLPAILKNYIAAWSLLLVAAISISLIAFLPIMNPKPTPSKKQKKVRKKLGDNASIYYFVHLRLFTAEKLLERIYLHYETEKPKNFMRSELDLARQTIMLSRITWRKYIFFGIAGHLTLITLLIPIPLLIIYWGNNLYERMFAKSQDVY